METRDGEDSFQQAKQSRPVKRSLTSQKLQLKRNDVVVLQIQRDLR